MRFATVLAAALVATSASAQQFSESDIAAKINCAAVELHEDGSVTFKQPLDLRPLMMVSGKVRDINVGGVVVDAVAIRKCKQK